MCADVAAGQGTLQPRKAGGGALPPLQSPLLPPLLQVARSYGRELSAATPRETPLELQAAFASEWNQTR